MRTRKEWAERPLAERELAAGEFIAGWNLGAAKVGDHDSLTLQSHLVVAAFALDLPDQPAPDRDVRVVAAVIEIVYPSIKSRTAVNNATATLAAIDAARRPS